MPVLDSKDQVVGTVLRELSTGSYVQTYLVLNFDSRSLLGYSQICEDTDLENITQQVEPEVDINCQWITKVGHASSRPKVLHCIEIGLPTGSQFFSVNSNEERDEWVESIKQCSMGQSTLGKKAVASMQQQKKDVGYQSVVVGGKVQRVLMPADHLNGREGSQGAEAAAAAASGTEKGGARRTRGFPRVIKAGHGTKLGAVMKNWKRRFFVLTEVSLGYYKTIEEVEPIRSISVGDMSSAGPSREIPGKDHMVEVVTSSRTYYIQVDSEEEVDEWVKAFQDIIKTVRGSHQPHPQSQSHTRELVPPPALSSDEESSTLV